MPMRLLHFADLHLGVENYGSLDPSNGLSSRINDFLRALDAIVDRAIREPVDAVLFAGDAFKSRDPSPTVQREFARRISRLVQHDVPIVLLIGNHDLPNVASRATAAEIYQVLGIPGVHVCRGIDLLRLETRSGPLQVVSLPWVTRSTFLSREDFRILAEADLDRAMRMAIVDAIGMTAARLDRSVPAVLLAHVSVQGASLGFEQSIMLGRDVTVGLDDLHAPAFDYVALGHIHRHQWVGTRPPTIYAGSPERIDFGEEREPKGYVLVSIENRNGIRVTTPEFVELPARRFKTLRINAPGDDPMATVERELDRAAKDVAGAIVRCFISVDLGRERAVSPAEVRRRLTHAGAHFVVQPVVEIESRGRARWELTDESGRDSESMLRRWVEMKDYDPAMRERVLTMGLELIQRRRQRLEGGSEGHG